MLDLGEKVAIEQAVLCLFLAIDANDAQRVAEGFTQDGVWHRRNGERVGRADIVEEMDNRPRGRRIQHLVINFIVLHCDAQSSEVAFKTLAFADDRPEPGQPSPMTLPIALDTYGAVLAKVGGDWRVSRLNGNRLFAS